MKTNEDRGIKNVLLTKQDKSEINIKGEQIVSASDVIKENHEQVSKTLFWVYTLILYKDKLEQDTVDSLLDADFGISQIKVVYDDGTEERLTYFGGKEKSKELTKVYCDDEFIEIRIESNEKGSN